MAYKLKFLKPDDDDIFKEDRSDVDANTSTTFVYNPFINQSIERQRQNLPVFSVRNHLLYLTENFQTVLVTGETGSGKSTQIPQYLIETNWDKDGIVGVVQPRRVAATSLAMRVAEEKSVYLGKEVGYSIRFDDCTTANVTKIKYMTEGLLVREMMADPLLRQYCCIMLDEVHERTLYTDILLGLMKKILKRRKDLTFIVCSATFDINHFFNFFNFNKTTDQTKDTVSVLSIKGRSYPVDIFYLKDPCPDYVKATVETILKIDRSQKLGDILAFLTGLEEVDACVQMLNEHANSQKNDSLFVLPMYGSLSNSEQLKVFQKSPKGTRKVVIATNIAETSVTIPDIVYVIDCGFVKLKWYDVKSHSDALVILPTSKAAALQRAGRSGRTQSGKVFRLYTEEQYEKLLEVTPPEMTRSNLSSAVLNLMALGIDNMLRFDFPSPPPSRHLISALDELFALGAFTEDGQLSNPLGQQMAELPLSPQLGKMLLVSGKFECSEEVLSIIAMLQVQNIFIIPYGKKALAKVHHRKFEVSEGDLLTLLNIYSAFIKNESKKWCNDNFLNFRALKRAKEIRYRMLKMLNNFDIPTVTSEGSIDPVCRCIAAGLFPNAAYLHYSGSYRTVRGNQTLYIHPTSVLYTEKQPQWVVFTELIHTTKIFMKDITVIEEEWLTELAPHFYEKTTVKNPYLDRNFLSEFGRHS